MREQQRLQHVTWEQLAKILKRNPKIAVYLAEVESGKRTLIEEELKDLIRDTLDELTPSAD